MKTFNVIRYNFNTKEFEQYNVIPFFVGEYNDAREKPVTNKEWKNFIKQTANWMFGGRCEYEVILKSWPNADVEKKIDIYNQVMMNIDIVVDLVKEAV